KYQEALKIEPFHVKILEGLILARLEKQECELARATLADLKKIDEEDNETLLLDFVTQSCADKPTQELLQFEVKSRDHRFYERTFRARALQLNSQYDLAIRHADEASQLDSNYPTPYYW